MDTSCRQRDSNDFLNEQKAYQSKCKIGQSSEVQAQE